MVHERANEVHHQLRTRKQLPVPHEHAPQLRPKLQRFKNLLLVQLGFQGQYTACGLLFHDAQDVTARVRNCQRLLLQLVQSSSHPRPNHRHTLADKRQPAAAERQLLLQLRNAGPVAAVNSRSHHQPHPHSRHMRAWRGAVTHTAKTAQALVRCVLHALQGQHFLGTLLQLVGSRRVHALLQKNPAVVELAALRRNGRQRRQRRRRRCWLRKRWKERRRCRLKLLQQLQSRVELRGNSRENTLPQMHQLLLHDLIQTSDFCGNPVLHLFRQFLKL